MVVRYTPDASHRRLPPVKFRCYMVDIPCTRCGETQAQMAAPPLATELGSRIYESICQVCWMDWLRHQTSIINHYGLTPGTDPEHRKFLAEQTETYLFDQPQA